MLFEYYYGAKVWVDRYIKAVQKNDTLNVTCKNYGILYLYCVYIFADKNLQLRELFTGIL